MRIESKHEEGERVERSKVIKAKEKAVVQQTS